LKHVLYIFLDVFSSFHIGLHSWKIFSRKCRKAWSICICAILSRS